MVDGGLYAVRVEGLRQQIERSAGSQTSTDHRELPRRIAAQERREVDAESLVELPVELLAAGGLEAGLVQGRGEDLRLPGGEVLVIALRGRCGHLLGAVEGHNRAGLEPLAGE
jgi:hypothetical protein